MFRKKIILVGGHISSGKNQFAQYLKEADVFKEYGENIRLDMFAHSLKHWAANDFQNLSNVLNNIADEVLNQISSKGCQQCEKRIEIEKVLKKLRFDYHNWFENKTEITRTLLQTYGTEIMRQHVKDNFWAEDTKSRIKADSNSKVVIITDFRFPNEAETIRDDDWDLYTIRIDRNVNTAENIASHASETSLDDYTNWSYIVVNDVDTTLKQLSNMAQTVAKDIFYDEQQWLPWPIWINSIGQ